MAACRAVRWAPFVLCPLVGVGCLGNILEPTAPMLSPFETSTTHVSSPAVIPAAKASPQPEPATQPVAKKDKDAK